MGSCIICGKSVDGRICDTHQEDVVFEFRGNHANQLTANRFYEGTVDGYADFGVFVDIGDRVTGLLHQSEIKGRLESLDWEPGDTVYVQVLRVRDNGDVDLGWSIREEERHFRGRLIDDPDRGVLLPEELDGETDESTETEESKPEPTVGTPSPRERTPAANSEDTSSGGGSAAAATTAKPEPDEDSDHVAADEPEQVPEHVAVETLSERVGERLSIEGEVVSVRQTGGPTIFEIRDETGAVDVAAFEGAGVRAYPDVESGELVRVVGEVEVRRDELQVESESLTVLDGEDAETVENRLETAMDDRARPDAEELLADHDAVAAVSDELVEAATTIRRAVLEARPVIVRHTATADGYVAGAAIERAVLPLVREEHARSDAEYHYFDRRPLEDSVYDMDDATADISNFLEDHERHDEPLPLVVLVDAGSTIESLEGYELLSVYDVDHLVVDADAADEDVADAVSTVVSPSLADADDADLTTTALAANLAVHVNSDVRDDLVHLPAVSSWENTPEDYRALATDAGYDETATRELREAVALAAYYQTYEDKRQLVTDLLFDGTVTEGDARGLAAHVSEQFREKLEGAVETAKANAEVREAGGVRFTVLDADRYADRFEFPPITLLADVLHRRDSEHEAQQVTLVITKDELYVRSNSRLDVRQVAEDVDEAVDNAGVRAFGGRDGRLEFVAGERENVLRATVQAVADLL